MLHFGNYEFKIILSIFIPCDKRNKQSQLVADGIGNIFNPCLCILYSDYISIVINPHIESTSISVCKCTDGFEIQVTPRLLEFYVLVLS